MSKFKVFHDFFNRSIQLKLLDLTLLIAFSIAIFLFFLYAIFLWVEVKHRWQPFKLVNDVNFGVSLLNLNLQKDSIRGVLKGNKARIIWNDEIIQISEQGEFELFF